MDKIGLHSGQDVMLLCLNAGEAISVSLLSERAEVRPSTVSKALNALCDKGLVDRIPDMHDGRRSSVSLTKAGIRIQEDIRLAWDELDEEIRSAGVAEDFEEELSRINDVMRARLRRLR